MSTRVLHIGQSVAITDSFFNFIKRTIDTNEHVFLFSCEDKKHTVKTKTICIEDNGLYFWLKSFYIETHKANKIILHGLFSSKLVIVLFCFPWLLRKSYWFIWGGDLYRHELSNRDLKWHILEFVRSRVIRNIGYLVTYIEGDVDLARKWYDAKGIRMNCLMYPSNIYKEQKGDCEGQLTAKKKIHIQVGNSADPSNNHIEAFRILENYKNDNIRIYTPLSYGDQDYAELIIRNGYERFGDAFFPLTKFMPIERYITFLTNIDIVVFNHNRQQAMGNTIALLGLGKKIHMRSDVTPWSMFRSLGIKVYDINDFNLQLIDPQTRVNNQLRVKDFFSEEKLINQLSHIFE